MTSPAVSSPAAWSQRPFEHAVSSRVATGATRAVFLVIVVTVGLVLAGRDIGDEGSVTLHADTPRYLMNGVFVADLVKDHPIQSPLTYAEGYFARYPALSLGLHPLLPPVVEAPFFMVFGVSVWAGRLSALVTFAAALWCWFLFVERIYGTTAAFVASLFLASTPMSIRLVQETGSEPLTICLILAALLCLQRYCDSERRGYAIGFVVTAVLSVYAKQLAILVAPVYALLFVQAFGVRRLFTRGPLIAIGIIGLCVLPVIPLTLKYANLNVRIVTEFIPAESKMAASKLLVTLKAITVFQAASLVVIAAVIAAGSAVLKRDRRALLFAVWLCSVFVGLSLAGVNNGRYAYYGAPALCALAASVIAAGKTTRQKSLLIALLAAATVQQIVMTAPRLPTGATGYEEAAKYVTDHRLGDSVLYSSLHDSGLFVFFVRKYDPRREMVVVRSDKVLTTSRMGLGSFEHVVHSPEEIGPVLNDFGVGYVVIEDTRYEEGPLEWLRKLVHGDQFVLRHRVPIVTSDPRTASLSLAIYEYKRRTPANRSIRFSMKIPVMNDTIGVTLGDLIPAANGR